MREKIVISDKLARVVGHFRPKIIGELNGQHLKLVKVLGDFTWHRHQHEDEMFLVLSGELQMQFRDGTVRLTSGECIVVPRGVEHCPRAEVETAVMLFEPAGTINTGDAGGAQTVANPDWI
jgi:mannose-6-phosphate isomerase-like protein (cupin superfamily)